MRPSSSSSPPTPLPSSWKTTTQSSVEVIPSPSPSPSSSKSPTFNKCSSSLPCSYRGSIDGAKHGSQSPKATPSLHAAHHPQYRHNSCSTSSPAQSPPRPRHIQSPSILRGSTSSSNWEPIDLYTGKRSTISMEDLYTDRYADKYNHTKKNLYTDKHYRTTREDLCMGKHNRCIAREELMEERREDHYLQKHHHHYRHHSLYNNNTTSNVIPQSQSPIMLSPPSTKMYNDDDSRSNKNIKLPTTASTFAWHHGTAISPSPPLKRTASIRSIKDIICPTTTTSSSLKIKSRHYQHAFISSSALSSNKIRKANNHYNHRHEDRKIPYTSSSLLFSPTSRPLPQLMGRLCDTPQSQSLCTECCCVDESALSSSPTAAPASFLRYPPPRHHSVLPPPSLPLLPQPPTTAVLVRGAAVPFKHHHNHPYYHHNFYARPFCYGKFIFLLNFEFFFI